MVGDDRRGYPAGMPHTAIRDGRTCRFAGARQALDQVRDVGTTFGNVVEDDDRSPERTSTATIAQGRHIGYRGTTVLESAGETTSRLRTYYDSAVSATAPAGTG